MIIIPLMCVRVRRMCTRARPYVGDCPSSMLFNLIMQAHRQHSIKFFRVCVFVRRCIYTLCVCLCMCVRACGEQMRGGSTCRRSHVASEFEG